MQKKRKINFEISERKILLRVIDLLVVFFSLYILGKITDFNYIEINKNFYWTALLSVYITIFGTIFDMYHLPTTTNKLQITKSIFLTTSVTTLFYLLTPKLSPVLPQNRIQIIYFYTAILIALLVWRWFYSSFLTSHRFVKKTVIICKDSQLDKLVKIFETDNPHHKIVGFINTESNNSNFENKKIKQINNIDEIEGFMRINGAYEIIVAPNTNAHLYHNELSQLMEKGISIKDYLYAYEQSTNKIPVDLIEKDFYKYFPFNRNNSNKLHQFLVRIGEVIFSIIGLVIMLVLLPFVLIGNLIANKGSLFYTQERVGKNGRTFRIIKFRTMIKDAEKDGVVFAQKNDLRITAFGKFLRRSRIDELPQLVNILKNEMAVIGPRPERPYFVEKITENMPFYPTRHAIKPGLTGWAQINYRYGDSIEDSIEKLKYDLYYIKHRSVFIDISIIIKTIGTVLYYRGQ